MGIHPVWGGSPRMTAFLFMLYPPGVKCKQLQSVLFFYLIEDFCSSEDITDKVNTS